MPRPPLRPPNPASKPHVAGGTIRDATHSPPAHVLLCGETLVNNAWVVDTLESASHRLEFHASLPHARRSLVGNVKSIIIMECAMRPANGGGVAFVRELDPGARKRVIAINWRAPWSIMRLLIDSGIGDFLGMPATASELLLRIHLRLREIEQPIMTSEPDVSAARDVLAERLLAEPGGIRLSPREARLFALLHQRAGTAVSRSEILERVFERIPGQANTNIADVYVAYLRAKLPHVAPELVITAVKNVGYRLDQRDQVKEPPS